MGIKSGFGSRRRLRPIRASEHVIITDSRPTGKIGDGRD